MVPGWLCNTCTLSSTPTACKKMLTVLSFCCLARCRGSALLVGVGGSGKQSVAKFAAFVAGHALHTVSMAVGYNLARFREEVKTVLKVGCGLAT